MKALLITVLLLTGCAFQDGYDFGDITKTLINAKNLYCNATDDAQRQKAKAELESRGINTGEESVCTLTVEVLIEKARQ